MLDHGHQHAMHYPISMVSEEARLVEKRLNTQMAVQTSLFQMALSSIPNMGVEYKSTKKSAKELADRLKDMADGQ